MEKRKKGETAQRIYKLLHRNPGLTTTEIAQQMPDLEAGTVQVAVSRMRQRGELERRAKKLEVGPTGKMTPHYTYHVKYNSRPQPQPQLRLKKTPAPKPAWTPPPVKPEPEGPTTPHAEREVLVLRHLADIYKGMNLMTEQQEALIQVLRGTLVDLAETKQELEEAQKARSFWGTIKGWFA